MMFSFCRMMLTAPWPPSIGRHARTRIRNDVQNGMTQRTKSAVAVVLLRANNPTMSAAG